MDYLLPARNTFSFAASTALAVLILTYLFYIIIIKSFFFVPRSAKKNGEKKKLYHPVVGTKLHQVFYFHRLHDYATDLGHKYKTFRFPGLFRSEIYTCDPANVEYILNTNFQNYGKGWYNYSRLKDFMGDGIFAVDGEKWRHQRKIASFEVSTKLMREFSSAVFQKNGAKLAQIVSENAISNLSMDFQDLSLKSTLDSTVEIAFGIKLNSLCGGSCEEGTLFANAFDDSNAMTMWRYIDIFWKIKRFLNIGSEARLKKNVELIDAFVYKVIRNNIESQDNSPMRRQDVLSKFINSNVTDRKYLRDIILNFVIAGKDSTSTALAWFFYMLCKHPHVQEKAAEEVREAIKMKDDTTLNDLAASVSIHEALDKMQYLHAAITETMRLYPALPVDAKICFSDDTLPDGFNVRKGDMVSYYPYAMGRMKYIWGDDADDFRPERWLDNHGIFQNVSAFKFPVFQAGPRICFGKEMAYRQMKIFAAILLAFFKFELSDQKKVVKYKTMITLQIAGGLHLRAFHRFPHNIPIHT